jgi:3-methyladenine DNA glycosylase AlkD
MEIPYTKVTRAHRDIILHGVGDRFLGISVPDLRAVAKNFVNLNLESVGKLLHGSFHEERFVALTILVLKYKKSVSEDEKNKLYNFYLRHTLFINNWDLVDTSAEHIVGAYLNDREKIILEKLARSKNLWERRIAILSTFYFIKQGRYQETFKISEILLGDTHDLIHKAVGWMLREVGKRLGQKIEEEFLQKYARLMPRTMLRYAVERFEKRSQYKYLKR